jgi:hypothetical protein
VTHWTCVGRGDLSVARAARSDQVGHVVGTSSRHFDQVVDLSSGTGATRQLQLAPAAAALHHAVARGAPVWVTGSSLLPRLDSNQEPFG